MGGPEEATLRRRHWFDIFCLDSFILVLSAYRLISFFRSALSAEVDRLKAAVNKVADKVNARGETAEARLDAVYGRVDQAIIQGVHLGVSLGLAAMSSRTNEDYSIQLVGFPTGIQMRSTTSTSVWRLMMITMLPLPNPPTPNPSSTSYLRSSLY